MTESNPASRLIGTPLLRVDRVGSTNDLLRHLAETGAPEGTVVVAREQSAGRGRRGRTWHSPPGGLWLSLLLRPPDPFDARITLAAAVGAAEGIRKVCGVDIRLKWPNDLILNGGKVGGILVESVPPIVIVGIGINANVELADLSARVAASATSLSAELGSAVDLGSLLTAVLDGIDRVYGALRTGGGDEVLERWRRLSDTLGRTVRIEGSGGPVEGIAVDVDAGGGLLLEAAGGVRQRVIAGDVVAPTGGERA